MPDSSSHDLGPNKGPEIRAENVTSPRKSRPGLKKLVPFSFNATELGLKSFDVVNFQNGRDMNINDVFFAPFLPRDFSTLGMNVCFSVEESHFFAGASNWISDAVSQAQKRFLFRLGFPGGYWCMVGRAALAAAMPPCSAPRAFC